MKRGREAKEERRKKAEALQEERERRSVTAQLALLDQRPGNSKKERDRLEGKTKKRGSRKR